MSEKKCVAGYEVTDQESVEHALRNASRRAAVANQLCGTLFAFIQRNDHWKEYLEWLNKGGINTESDDTLTIDFLIKPDEPRGMKGY